MRIMKLMLPATMLAAVMGSPALAAAEPVAPATGNPTLDDNKLICRKTLETGSLVRKAKQCFTALEWDRIAQQTRIGNERLAAELSTRSSGN